MPKAHRLMYSLIYPAVLGTVLINLFIPLSNFISGQPIKAPEFTGTKLILTLGIVFHFAIDFLFAEEAQEHGWTGFAIDILIILGLWVAAAAVQMNTSNASNISIICGALAGVYLVFLFYVLKVYDRIKHWYLVATVEGLGLVWFLIGAFWTNTAFAASGLFLFGTLLAYTVNKALQATPKKRRT